MDIFQLRPGVYTIIRADKDIFFESFYDCIGQGVFYSVFFSRSRLNSEKGPYCIINNYLNYLFLFN